MVAPVLIFPAMSYHIACWNCSPLGTSNKDTILLPVGRGMGPCYLTLKIPEKTTTQKWSETRDWHTHKSVSTMQKRHVPSA